MTVADWQRVKTIFNVAVDLAADERTAYLHEACCGDAMLQDEVASLLASHDHADGFLDSTAVVQAATLFDEDQTSRWIGRRIGPHVLVEEIGRGGMGQVFRARRADGQYQSEVAIKLVRGACESEVIKRRFLAERQILAGLVHPGIARLLDGGTTSDHVPYLVMELVEGEPIDAYCTAGKLAIAARLRLFLAVCEAVSFAHRHLVVHRDLKPSNIFITRENTVKLLDFGVAKVLDSMTTPGSAQPTVTLMRALTLNFASPEQVRGEPVTTASDVYSLGVLLYHLLTGKSPYASANGPIGAVSREICEQVPSPPSAAGSACDPKSADRDWRSRVRGDLDSIVLRALQKDPTRRYSSVDLFAADVRRYLEDRPVLARGNAMPDRVGKFIRRNRLATVAAGAALLAVVAALLLIQRGEHARARQAAEQLAAAHLTERVLLQQLQTQRGAPDAARESAVTERLLRRLESLAAGTRGEEKVRRELDRNGVQTATPTASSAVAPSR